MTVDFGLPAWAAKTRRGTRADPDVSHGVPCPNCGGDSHVIDSRPRKSSIRRRRVCDECERRFTTFEIVTDTNPGGHARALRKQAAEMRRMADLVEQMAGGQAEDGGE